MRMVWAVLIGLTLFGCESAVAAGFGKVSVYPADQGPVFATIADVNHDGIFDLLVLNSVSNDLSVLIGNADGTYQSPVNYPVGVSPTAMAFEFFNKDSNLDIAIANSGSNDISILLGNADGTFQPAVEYGVGTGISPRAIVLDQFTNSGFWDLAVANAAGGDNNKGNVAIFLGNGDGTFQAAKN